MDLSITAMLIYVLLFLLLLLFLIAKYNLSYWNRRGVSTPPTSILFGNFQKTFTFQKAPGLVLQDIYEYANPTDPYVGFYVFHKPGLLLRDVDLIKRIMVKDFDIFPNRQFGGKLEKDSVGLVNLLSVRQPRWKYLRTKMTPALTGNKLRRLVNLMAEIKVPLFDYLNNLDENSEGWKEVELKSVCSKYTTDVISSVAFGIQTNSFNMKDTAFWDAGQKILSGFKRGIILLIMFFVPELIGYIQPLITGPAHFFRIIFWDSMNTREKMNYTRGDLIDSFIALKNEKQNDNFKFEGDNLLAQAVSFYVAGFEASSTAIAFTLFELAQHEDCQKRLYDEICEHIANDELTIEKINGLEYLEHVVNESLRLYPPLPLVDRVALEDYEIPEYNLKIEKGTVVYVSLNGINRDPRYFSNPTKFDPDREELSRNNTSYSDFAFGVGPRSCVGKRIGLLLTKVAIITIVREYEIFCKPTDDKSLNPLYVFTNAADGIRICFKKR